MAAKFTFFLLIAFCIFYLTTAIPSRQVRETESDAGKTIDDAVTKIKSTVDDLVKQVQDSDVWKVISENVEKLQESIKDQGNQLIEKIKTKPTE